jgi:GABA(A) receptor-associated protein
MFSKKKIKFPCFEIQKLDFDQRIKYSSRLTNKYPDYVPVIIKKNDNDKILQDIDKEKYLIPKNLNIGEIIHIIRRRISLDSKQAIFVFMGNGILVPISHDINTIYQNHKDPDGFLYLIYATENTFG